MNGHAGLASKKLSPVEAAIFDRDFTILRTLEVSYRTVEELFRVAGTRPPSRLLVRAAWTTATSDREFWKILTKGSTPKRGYDWFEIRYRRVYPRFLHLAQPYPNTGKLLEGLRSRGIKVALVSALPSLRATTALLARHRLDWLIDQVVTVDVVKDRVEIDTADHFARKREVVGEAIGRLQVKPARSIMVGDSPVDVKVGRHFGMQTAAVIGTEVVHGIFRARPDLYLIELGNLLSAI